MSTIGRMVVAIEGDESGLRQSMGRSLKLVRQFADSATQEMMRAVPATKGKDAGLEFARGLIQGAQRELRINRAYLVEGLLGGNITLQQFKQEGTAAAEAFNTALGEGMRQLRNMGFNPENNLRAFEVLARAMKTEGMKSAQAYARGLEEEMAKRRAAMASAMAQNVRSAMGVAERQIAAHAGHGGGGLMGMAKSMGAGMAFTGAIFGLEQIVRAEGKAEKAATGVRSALQSVAMYASMSFGPKGLIVAGLAAGAAAIIDYFAQARKEMRETRKAFEDEISRMVDAGNSIGLIAKIRDLEVGKPSAGMGAGGFFKGSIGDLQTQYNDRVDIANKSGNILEVLRAQREMRALMAQMKPLVAERDALREAVLNRPDALPEIRGLPAVQINAKGPNALGKESRDAFREMLDSARDLVAIMGDMRAEGANTEGVAGRLLNIYDEMVAKLAAMPNPWSDQGRELRKMIADVKQNANIIDILRGSGTGTIAAGLPLASTPTQGPFGQRQITGSATASAPKPDLSRFDVIGAQLTGMFSSLGSTIAATITSALGPMVILGKILEPGLRALEPLINSLIAPLAAVVQVIAVGLEPVFRLLFPIVKGVAIVFSFLAEMTARLTAMLAQAIGGFVKGIGSLLRKIPGLGGLGKSVQRAGQSLLDFSDGMKQSANQMKETRKNLQAMQFGDTIDSVTGLGAAADAAAGSLRNVPELFKMSLQQMRAFGLSTGEPASPLPAGATSGGSGGGVVVENLHINGGQGKPRDIAVAVVRELERLSEAQYGTTNRWAEVTVS